MVNDDAYSHLLPAVRSIAALPAHERIAHIGSQRWIGYPAAQRAVARLEQLISQPRTLRPPSMLVIGPSNNGKSMIAERLRRAHPPVTSLSGAHEIIPLVVMQMPGALTIRRFYGALLSALGCPMLYGATDILEQMTLRIMRQVEVRLLVIDEVHNMLAGRVAQQREFLNVLRFISNELRLPLACLGTREAYLAVRSDDQLENRFEPFMLPRWTDNADLGRLLASFEATLPLREKSGLSSPALRSLILQRSEGTIGEMAALLGAATRLALSNGCERIDADILARADYRAPSERRRHFEAALR